MRCAAGGFGRASLPSSLCKKGLEKAKGGKGCDQLGQRMPCPIRVLIRGEFIHLALRGFTCMILCAS